MPTGKSCFICIHKGCTVQAHACKQQWVEALRIKEVDLPKELRVYSHHFTDGNSTKLPSVKEVCFIYCCLYGLSSTKTFKAITLLSIAVYVKATVAYRMEIFNETELWLKFLQAQDSYLQGILSDIPNESGELYTEAFEFLL